MEKTGTFTKSLAIVGTILVWLPIVALVVITLGSVAFGQGLRVDYLIPAELFPLMLAGSGLLLWAALRARSRRGLIGWGICVALAAFGTLNVVASASGLASGAVQIEDARGWFIVLNALVAVYSLAIPEIGTAGALLLRDLFRKGGAGTMTPTAAA